MTAMVTRPVDDAALRPLTGLVGRSSDVGRLLGHLDAGRSVWLQAARGAGTTALLRSLCAEQSRPSVPDGVLALPAGLPVLDLPAAARRLRPDDDRPLAVQRLLVILDDRTLQPEDVAAVAEAFPAALLLVAGPPQAPTGDLVPLPLVGLSEHHAVGLIEAAVGRALTLDEGRAARWVAAALEGMPIPLVQAAAAVRDGGLTFTEIRDLLDDPPRPGALTTALQNALDDGLYVTLTTLASLGDVPSPTPLVAAATQLPVAEVVRRLRRLALLGLVTTDGRDGWTAVDGIAPVSPSLHADAADRLVGSLPDLPGSDMFTTAAVCSVVDGRARAEDHRVAGALAGVALAHLPLDGLDETRRRLEQAAAWAASGPDSIAAEPPADTNANADADADADADESAPVDDDAQAAREPTKGSEVPADEEAPAPAEPATALAGVLEPAASSRVAALLSDWRRLAMVAVVAAAVVVGVLLVAPSLRSSESPNEPLQSTLDLGTTSLGQSGSGTLQLDLSSQGATLPVALTVSGPDGGAFTLSPTECETDCRSTVTFTPQRSGAHLATVTGTDADGRAVAVADVTGTGTGDAPAADAETDLAVTLFPAEPSPLPAGGSGVVQVGVRNTGPDPSSGSQLVVTVPEEVTASARGCTFKGTTLTCPLTGIAVGEDQRVAVTLEVPAGSGPVQVGATVTPAAGNDEATADNAAGFTYPVG